MKTSPATAKETSARLRAYFAGMPPVTRRALKQLRATIRAAIPEATDTVSYGIPAIRVDGRFLLWYAGWKEHIGLYPMTATITRAYARELKGYIHSKATVRFPLGKRLPVPLVKRLVKARLMEIRRPAKK